MSQVIIINRESGTALACSSAQLRQAFSLLGDDIHIVAGSQLAQTLDEYARREEVQTIIIAGGDGSVSLAGAFALKHEKRLAVVPLGTMNLFARALGMPLDLHQAIGAIAEGSDDRVDVGWMNGAPFLNHVSVGLHPKVILMRDQMPRSGRLSKIWNGMKAYWRLLASHKRTALRISGDFEPVRIKAGLAVVSVNPLPEVAAHLPYRDGQRFGKLGFYVSTHSNAWQLNVLFARMFAGSWHASEHIQYREAEEVTIEAPKAMHVSRDGEVCVMRTPLRCSIDPKALRVVRPPEGHSAK